MKNAVLESSAADVLKHMDIPSVVNALLQDAALIENLNHAVNEINRSAS